MLEFILSNIFQEYCIIILMSILISFLCINLILSLSKTERLYLLSCYVFSMLGMVIGAKGLYILECIVCNKVSYLALFSGFGYMGGVLGYIIFINIYNRIYKGVPTKINNLMLLSIPIIYSISKIGCYLSVCCNGITNIPLQLIECIIYFVIFTVFSFLYRRYNKKDLIANLSIIVLSISRFIIDYYRLKRNIIIFNLTITQIVCIIITIKFIQLCIKVKNKSF